jgi:hypothetical protein
MGMFQCLDCGTVTFQLVCRGSATGDKLAQALSQLTAMLAVVADDSSICVGCSNHDCDFETAVADVKFAFAAVGCLSNYFQE